MATPRIALLLGSLLLLISPVLQAASLSQKTLELQPGLHYQNITTFKFQAIHVLEIDPKRFILKSVHAENKLLGRTTVEQMAKQHNAIAAINGGFFEAGDTIDGLPAGILKIAKQWYSIAYQNRAAMGWSSSHHDSVLIDRVQTKTSLNIHGKNYPVHGINRPLQSNRCIVYTSLYGETPSPRDTNAMDVIIENNRVVNIKPAGKSIIPQNGLVYAIGSRGLAKLKQPKIGEKVDFKIEVLPQFSPQKREEWKKIENIVGGAPVLIDNGNAIRSFSTERMPRAFTYEPHARTAFGVLKNGHWIVVVVEQNLNHGSMGMTIPELAQLMKKLGATTALNLDGGSSSSLYLSDPAQIGYPNFRQVSDAILVLPR